MTIARGLGVGLFSLGIAAITCAENQSTSYIERFRWRAGSDKETAEGLYAFDSSASGAVHWLFFEGPGGGRVVLSFLVDPRNGLKRKTLIDDESGWWLQLTEDLGVRAETLSGLASKAQAELTADKKTEYPAGIRTSTGRSADVMTPFDREGANCRDVIRQLAESDRDRLVHKPSRQFGEALGFLDERLGLDASGSPEPGVEFRCVVEIVMSAGAGSHEPSGLGAWSKDVTSLGQGLEVSDPTELSFLSRFKSVKDPRNPLAGRRVDDETKERKAFRRP